MPSREKSQELEKSIFATIAYYDYFNYPLTAAEIYHFLIKIDNQQLAIGKKPNFAEILDSLDNSENLKKLIDQKNGFYFLKGREEIICARIQRKKLTDEKFKKSRWILKFLSYMPFVRLMMMSGTMAVGNPYKESDIDLLVVAKAGRIWTVRALLTFFALVFGKYRHKRQTKNRLCLNHHITDKSLAIDFGNLYKAQEYLNLIPIAGELKIYDNFLLANQKWMEKYVYCSDSDQRENIWTFFPQKIFLKTKRFFEWLFGKTAGDWLEKFFKKIQIFFIQRNPLSNQPEGRLRYTDDNLVFHPVLIEPEVINRFNSKLATLSKDF